MKKIIRLTESDLHKIVNTCIKRIIREEKINELDWKTYMNASKKAYDNDDDYYRSDDFLDAAKKAYGKKYGAYQKDGKYHNYGTGGNVDYSDMITHTDGDISDEFPDDYVLQRTTTTFTHDRDYGPDVDSEIGDVYDSDIFGIPRNSEFASSYQADKYKDGTPEWNDVRDYIHGKSKYAKGKGWK